MYTSFTDWKSGLTHYGVVGMKWGVRRYQRKDGTLTAAGKRQVARRTEGYLNESREDRISGRNVERRKVARAYQGEYNKALRRGMPDNSPSKEGRKLWYKYEDAFAEATLKDLGFRVTDKAREHVKSIIRSIDAAWDYDISPDDWDRLGREAYERHQRMAHPIKSRFKKG